MTSKPLHEFLNALLQRCRENGTSVQESGIRVSTQLLTGEIIIVFHIDSDEGRKSLKMEDEGIRICDFIFYYTKENEVNEVVCLLELKGTELLRASDQVKKTHQRLIALTNEAIHSKYHRNLTWRICICLRGQAPATSQRIRDELKELFGKHNVEIRHGVKHHDIGPLLRRNAK